MALYLSSRKTTRRKKVRRRRTRPRERRHKRQLRPREDLQRNNWLDQEFQSSYVSDELKEGSIPYVAFDSDGHQPGYPGWRTRASQRWFRYWSSKRFSIPVPYIDRFGKFTFHRLGNWYTYPETWFASLVSTIDSRLWSLLGSRSRGVYRFSESDRNLVTRISILYAYTHNNYFMDRILATLRPGKLGVSKSIFNSFRTRLGETFRFVYSQTSIQVSWLNFRSKWIRDKPLESTLKTLDSFSFVKRRKKGIKVTLTEGNPYLETLNYLRVNRLEVTRDGYWYSSD